MDAIIKERFAVQLANGRLVLDEESNSPLIRPTKRALYLMYGPDANVVPVTCTYQVVEKAKKKA